MQDSDYGSVIMTIKEGEAFMVGDSKVTFAKVGGHKTGKGVRVHVRALKVIPVYRLKKEKDAPKDV